MPRYALYSIVLILLASATAHADPLTVEWSLDSTRAEDSWISLKYPDEAHGGGDTLVTGTKGMYRRSLIGFNGPSLLPGSTLLTAELSLYVQNFKGAANDSAVIAVHRMTGAWQEGSVLSPGVTWNESAPGVPWTTAGGDYDTTTVAAATIREEGARATWDITPLIQFWIDNPDSSFGLMLRSHAEIKIIDIDIDGGDGSIDYGSITSEGMAALDGGKVETSRVNVTFASSEGDTSVTPRLTFTIRPPGDLLPAFSSAVAEIHPEATDGGIRSSFRCYAALDIALSGIDTGVDRFFIPMPAGFDSPSVTGVTFNGDAVPFDDRSGADSLVVDLASVIGESGVLEVDFGVDAPTPDDPESFEWLPEADNHSSSYPPQAIDPGDGNGVPGDVDRCVVLVHGRVARIEVAPDGDTISADDTLAFTARGFDSGENEISVAPVWALAGSVGSLDPATGVLDATTPGFAFVRASAGGVTDSARVDVTHGAPVYFAVTPVTASITTDEQVDFNAVGVDADFNWFIPENVSWSHPSGLGAIDSAGTFTPTGIGDGVVIGATAGLADTVAVTVGVGALASLDISPAAAVVSSDSSLQFTAAGRDALGFELNDPGVLTWSGGAGIGVIDAATGAFDPTTVGTGSVQVAAGGVTGVSGAIEVVPGAPAAVAVSPGSALLEVGHTAQFTAAVTDADGNAVADAVSWSAAGSAGSVDSTGLFTAAAAGTGAVIAAAGAAADTATVTVLENEGLTVAAVVESRDGVTRGEEGLLVGVALENATGSPVTGIESGLAFAAGGADRSAEYTVTVVDAGGDTLADGDTDTLLYRVDIDSFATVGEAVTVNAFATGVLAGPGTVVGAAAADAPGGWIVTDPPLVIDLERSLFPTSAVAGQSAGFWIGVRNRGGTSIQLASDSKLMLSDGSNSFEASLATAALLPPDSSVVSLYFGSTSLPAGFDPGPYDADIGIEGTDGNGAAYSRVLATSANTLNVLPPYILVEARAVSGAVVSPAADSIPLLRLELINLYTGSRTLSSLAVTDRTTGTGTAAERDSIWNALHLVADRDGDGVWDPSDDLLDSAPFTDSTALFGGFGETLAAGDTLELLVVGDLDPALTPDGLELDAAVVSAAGFGFDQESVVEGDLPADSPGSHFVDGFVAAQLLLTGSAPTELPAGADDSLVMEIVIPSNGFEEDLLKSLTVENAGADEASADITEVRLWSDGGDGEYGGASADDEDIGQLFWTGAAWTRTGIDLTIPRGGKLLFVTLDVSETPTPGSVVQFSVPAGGIQMASANDGPIDASPLSPMVRVIGAATGLVLSDVRGGGAATVRPGETGVELLRFTLANLDSTDAMLRGLQLLNQSTSRSGDPDSIFGALSLHAGGAPTPLSSFTFDGGGGLFAGIDLAIPAEESISLSIRANVGTGCVSDGDTVLVGIVDGPAFVFDTARSVTGPFPVEPPGETTVDGMAAAQIEVHDIEGGALTPAGTDRLALQITVPRNGCLDDVLQSIEVDNREGTAGTDDIARLYVTTGLPPDDVYVDDLVFIGSSWIRASLGLPVEEGGLVINVRVDMTAGAADSRTVRLGIPVGGIVTASDNDGPVDEPVVSPALFVVTDAPLFASFIDDLPAVISVGQELDVTMKVENLGDSLTLYDARPDSFGAATLPVSVLQEPPPDSTAILGPGESARFTWRVRVDSSGTLRFEGNAVGRAGEGASMDTTFLAESAEVTVQVPPDSVALDAVSTFPISILRGDRNVPAMRLTLAHGNAGSEHASIAVSAVTLTVDDGDGSPVTPGSFLDALTLRDNSAVIGAVSLDSVQGDTVTVPFDEPIVLEPGDERSVDLSLDLGLQSDVIRFRLLLDPNSALSAVDVNSGEPVELSGEAVIPSSTVEIVDPPAGLNVTVHGVLPAQINRGASNVPLFDFDLASVETPGNPAEITVSRISIVYADDVFPYDSLTVSQRGNPTPHFTGSGWVRADSVLHFDLDPAIVVPPDITVEVELRGRVAAGAPLGAARFGVSDSLFVSPVGAGQLHVDVHLVLNETLETMVVDRTDSLRVAATGPADTSLAVPGAAEREAFHLTLIHDAGENLSDVTAGLFRFRMENASGDSVEVFSLLDRVRVVHDGDVIASVAPLERGIATLIVPLDEIATLELSAGERETLDVDVDVRANAPPGDYSFVFGSGDFEIREKNEGTAVAVALQGPGDDPFRAGPLRLRRPSDEVLYWADLALPAATVPAARLEGIARLRLLAAGGDAESPLHMEGIAFRLEDEGGAPFDAGEAVARAELHFDGSESVYDADLDGDRIRFVFDPPVELTPGDTAGSTLDVELAGAIDRPSFRIAFPPGEIALSEAVDVVRSGSDTGRSPSPYTHLARKDFEASLRNYPNPFSSHRAETTIAFYARSSCRATVRIYTGLGIPVRTLEATVPAAGLVEVVWDGRNGDGKEVLSGVYVGSVELSYGEGGRDHAIHKIAVLN